MLQPEADAARVPEAQNEAEGLTVPVPGREAELQALLEKEPLLLPELQAVALADVAGLPAGSRVLLPDSDELAQKLAEAEEPGEAEGDGAADREASKDAGPEGEPSALLEAVELTVPFWLGLLLTEAELVPSTVLLTA